MNFQSAREHFKRKVPVNNFNKKVPVNLPKLPVNMYILPGGLGVAAKAPKKDIVPLMHKINCQYFPFQESLMTGSAGGLVRLGLEGTD